MFTKIILPALAVAALGFAVYYVAQGSTTSPPAPPPVAPAAKPAGTQLAGSGIIEPKTKVISVSPPVPGIVVEVIDPARVGQEVKKGELLFRLDDKQARLDLEVREAQLAAAQAQLQKLLDMPRREEVEPLKAAVDAAQTDLKRQEAELARAKRAGYRAVSFEERDQREGAVKLAKARLARA